MKSSEPQYLLFTESHSHASGDRLWRFLLLHIGTEETVIACDVEPSTTDSRAELLAVVRGLEAIDRPGKVKLVTGSGYVSRGFARGLRQWRAQGWHWERFGRRVPVRDYDLWQRIDRALEFHTVDCHAWEEPSAPPCEAPELPAARVCDIEPRTTEPSFSERRAPRIHWPDRRSLGRRPRLAAATQRTAKSWRDGLGTPLLSRLAPAG